MGDVCVLGIESSCDETAAAVVSSSGEVLSDVVRSQVELHAPHGGVVPELAARDHLRAISRVTEQALAASGRSLEQLDAIAVTARPGLIGAVLVGVQFAKGLALVTRKPLVAVDHLVGHVLSPFLSRDGTLPARPLPYVCLVASGGHTALYVVRDLAEEAIEELGGTRDDAAGEAFDKVAKLLGLGYPGGPVVDRLARQGRPRFALPRPLLHRSGFDFSFSGLKTCVADLVAREQVQGEQAVADLCASFQSAVADVLVGRLVSAAQQLSIGTICIAGGVAANSAIRAKAAEAAARAGLTLLVPSLASCTDNGAMIAFAGAHRWLRGQVDGLAAPATTRSTLRRPKLLQRPPRPTRGGRLKGAPEEAGADPRGAPK